MLRFFRILFATLFLLGITLLVLDATGVSRHYLGWMAQIQLLPAVLAMNVGVVVLVLLVTFFVGRLYCSVLCPMGVFQDLMIWAHKFIFGKKRPYRYRKPANWLRYTVLAVFVLLMLLGLGSIASLVAPYSAYARMVANIHGTGWVHWVAIATLCCVGVMSFMYGRLWCNTLCPVGALLGLISRYSFFGIRIDKTKCLGCRQCESRCKATCIDIENKTVDGSRCVMCFNCLGKCKEGAISLSRTPRLSRTSKSSSPVDSSNPVDSSRRRFLATTAAVGAVTVLQAQEQKLDGGLAVIEHKQVPKRNVPLKPAGAVGLKHFKTHCTACQLCVSQCPEKVLRPSTDLATFMQPYMAFDQGYCRLACTRCSEVCPTDAIRPIDKEQKTAISVGCAVVLTDNCIGCGACARHCPSGAILMVNGMPAVNENRCLGCGACEYYCPARPMTAIYVEGREHHAEI